MGCYVLTDMNTCKEKLVIYSFSFNIDQYGCSVTNFLSMLTLPKKLITDFNFLTSIVSLSDVNF